MIDNDPTATTPNNDATLLALSHALDDDNVYATANTTDSHALLARCHARTHTQQPRPVKQKRSTTTTTETPHHTTRVITGKPKPRSRLSLESSTTRRPRTHGRHVSNSQQQQTCTRPRAAKNDELPKMKRSENEAERKNILRFVSYPSQSHLTLRSSLLLSDTGCCLSFLTLLFISRHYDPSEIAEYPHVAAVVLSLLASFVPSYADLLSPL